MMTAGLAQIEKPSNYEYRLCEVVHEQDSTWLGGKLTYVGNPAKLLTPFSRQTRWKRGECDRRAVEIVRKVNAMFRLPQEERIHSATVVSTVGLVMPLESRNTVGVG